MNKWDLCTPRKQVSHHLAIVALPAGGVGAVRAMVQRCRGRLGLAGSSLSGGGGGRGTEKGGRGRGEGLGGGQAVCGLQKKKNY